MRQLEEFRIYYNRTIHPELLRMERLRLRLLRLVAFSGLLFLAVILFEFYINLMVVSLLLMIPLTIYIGYLIYRIRKFKQTFKPRVMNLILDFIDDGLNRGTLYYDSKKFLPKERFLQSRLFVTKAPYYQGEDHIKGKVGEMDFELCELDVREYSSVRNRLEFVFKGVFLYAVFPEEVEGEIAIWPRDVKQYVTRSIREFTFTGGYNADYEILNDRFRQIFLTFATGETHVAGILSEPMQDAIVDYIQQTGKELYISFINQEIFVAVTETKDMLEPYIFRSNLSYDLVKEFFEDINLLLRIIEDFDQTH